MVSGIPTASGYEERIRFPEIEVVERGASEEGLIANIPEGHWLNGWDVNVIAVRQTNVKRHIKSHPHAVSYDYRLQLHARPAYTKIQEFLIRVRQEGEHDVIVGRRYGAFVQLQNNVRPFNSQTAL